MFHIHKSVFKTLRTALLSLIFILFGISTVEAACSYYFKWSCPGCGNIGGATSGTQGPYSSSSQCNSDRARIQSPVSAGSCYKQGVCEVTKPTGQGAQTPYDPDAGRKQQEAADRLKQQQEEERQRIFNQDKNQALGQLKGIEGTSGNLSGVPELKGGTSGFDSGLKSGTTSSGLGLKQPRFSKGTKYSAPVDAREYAAATGEAFTEAEQLTKMIEGTNWPMKAKATFLLGVLMAERGSYGQAVSYFQTALSVVPSEPWIVNALDIIRGLQAVQAVRKGSGPIAWGMIDPATLGVMPKAARDRVLIAVSLVDIGDFGGALDLLKEARKTAPADKDLQGAEAYVRQLVAQKRERESTLSDQEKAQRVATARANGRRDAAWRLGLHLDNYGDNSTANFFYMEAQTGFSTDSYSYRLLDQMITNPDDFAPMPEIPLYSSKAGAILDALQYGDGNWDRSVRYLEAANKAEPGNLFVRDALNYVQGMTVYAEK
ncbi:MAG: hypothetical protein IH901_03240 [Proteobacteria bacterium]|nr:hypothetical protein [Pseudomonadota bacterium]